MNPKHSYGAATVWCVLFFFVLLPNLLMPKLCAQETAAQKHIGAPQDWSQRQIVFSRDALARHPDLINREPRIRQQMMQHWQAPNLGAFDPSGRLMLSEEKPGLARDWNVAFLGGRMHRNIFPAKYSFDPSALPDCVNDYVVFGLNIAGADGGQANLVAFNNLYVNSAGTGFCSGTAPNVLFAYNVTHATGGKIVTSPVISLDGKKIAFVESAPAPTRSAIFHVLTWAAGAGSIGGASPTNSSNMTSLPFNATGSSTTSSPWVDYDADTAYVGDDVGNIYQITPVFNGTPALSSNPNWPVQLSGTAALTPPVLDTSRGLLMVGSNNGNLYQIDTATGVFRTLPVGAAGTTSFGIIAPPIVDPTNGTTFVVSANNGTSAVLVQTETATLLNTTSADIGIGGHNTGANKVHLYQPAFSNAYYSDPSNGVVSLCGTGAGATDTSPWQYEFGFTGATMKSTPVTGYPKQLSTNTTDGCTGWTEFFNPNAGPTDTITATSVTSDVLTVTANNSDLTVGEQVLIEGTGESFLNGQTVTVASLVGTGPLYSGFTANFTTANYSNPTDTGTVAAINVITATSVTSNVLTVTAINSNLTVGEQVYIQGTAESFLNGQTVTVAGLLGSAPLYTGFTANFTASNYGNLTDTGTASAGTDFFFFGLTGDCITVLGDAITATSVASNVLTVTANNSFTVGEKVYIQGTHESFLNGQSVTIASLIGSGPMYTGFTANFTASNYSNPTDAGTVGVSTTGCVVALGNSAGTTTTTTAYVNGGPSGIVVDNYSSASQASSIYLMSVGSNIAYKFTQEGLQ